ncbi:OadG family transporter subunit [Planctomycetota bacterium]
MPFAQQASGMWNRFTLQPLTEDHGIPLAIMGIFVVFTALALVALMITLLPRVLKLLLPDQPPPSKTALAPEVTTDDELSEEILVVIAAAVAATIHQPQQIVRIRGLASDDLGWSLEGRSQHHHSHQMQHRDRR